MSYSTVKISAIVICFNDATHLADSLESLSLCDEILFFDMGSTDGSVEIAEKYSNQIQSIERVEIVEKVWEGSIKTAENDWVILLDPDEIFPAESIKEIRKLISENPKVSLISIPWKYYFLGKPLNSTHWGKDHFKARVFNRQHVEISGLIFDGIKLKPGFETYKLPYSSGYIIRHYWIDSIPQLFGKHWRYIKHDGEDRYHKGQRFTLKRQIIDSYKTLRKDLLDYNGIKDGIRGIFLSFFHAWFIWMCHFSLWKYQTFKAGKLEDESSSGS